MSYTNRTLSDGIELSDHKVYDFIPPEPTDSSLGGISLEEKNNIKRLMNDSIVVDTGSDPEDIELNYDVEDLDVINKQNIIKIKSILKDIVSYLSHVETDGSVNYDDIDNIVVNINSIKE